MPRTPARRLHPVKSGLEDHVQPEVSKSLLERVDHCDRDVLHAAPPFKTVQKKRISHTVGGSQARFIRMKSASKKRAPTIVNLTVKRRYLTEREVERLMDCARKHGRYGHRDATMILVAYRHGLRASEVCDLQWQQIELSEGRLHVHASRTGLRAYIRSGVTRCGRCVSYAAITPGALTSSFPSAAGQSVPSASTDSSSASASLPRCPSRSTHTCCAMPV